MKINRPISLDHTKIEEVYGIRWKRLLENFGSFLVVEEMGPAKFQINNHQFLNSSRCR
jgi:hypothetical protein